MTCSGVLYVRFESRRLLMIDAGTKSGAESACSSEWQHVPVRRQLGLLVVLDYAPMLSC